MHAASSEERSTGDEELSTVGDDEKVTTDLSLQVREEGACFRGIMDYRMPACLATFGGHLVAFEVQEFYMIFTRIRYYTSD